MSKLTIELFEGLEQDDLSRLVHPKLHIDEFKSKMGDDLDIIVLSFKVDSKNPANDLMNFIERGYEWVLDADVSTGELDDGNYLVFVELERDYSAPEHIEKLVRDILNLTGQKLSDWHFQYQKNSKEYPIDVKLLRKIVPLTPDSYILKYGQKDSDDLDSMMEAARVPIRRKAPENDLTDFLRVAAGIK
jgi:hypothetical protein